MPTKIEPFTTMKNVDFRPGDTTYKLKTDSNGPFHKRNLPTFPNDGKTKSKLLLIKSKYYELFYQNEKESYTSRNLPGLEKAKFNRNPKFLPQKELKGNPKQINYNILKISHRIVSGLKNNPHSLFLEADRIEDICKEIQFKIPHIQAFEQVKDWNEFMQLIDSLVSHRTIDQFEFLIAAILQYAKRCRQ